MSCPKEPEEGGLFKWHCPRCRSMLMTGDYERLMQMADDHIEVHVAGMLAHGYAIQRAANPCQPLSPADECFLQAQELLKQFIDGDGSTYRDSEIEEYLASRLFA